MGPVLARLVDAVRSLRTTVVDTPDLGRRVRFDCEREELPARLLDLHDALEAVDGDGAADDPTQDPVRMREALVALMRFAAVRGISEEEIRDVVRASVEGRVERHKELVLAHKPKAPTRRWKPALVAPMDRLAFLSRENFRREYQENVDKVSSIMGTAAPGPDRR